MPRLLRLVPPIAVLLAACLAVIAPSCASAQLLFSATAPHLTVSLLVPPGEIYPGQTFTAGLDFRLDEGWHVYWINAGDSGEPPAIAWKLPAGITAGAMQFPPPSRLPLGPLMDFGYENEVVFPIPIQVAADYHPSQPEATLAAHVTWLVCREVCIPGKADLAVMRPAYATTPPAPSVDLGARGMIARFQAQLPKALPAADSATFSSSAKNFVLNITGTKTASAQFFPLMKRSSPTLPHNPPSPHRTAFSSPLRKTRTSRRLRKNSMACSNSPTAPRT